MICIVKKGCLAFIGLAPLPLLIMKLDARLLCIGIWTTVRKTRNRQNLQSKKSRDIILFTWIPSSNVWKLSTLSRIFIVCLLRFHRDWFIDILCVMFSYFSFYGYPTFSEFKNRNALNCMDISLTVCIKFCINLVGLNSSFRYMF